MFLLYSLRACKRPFTEEDLSDVVPPVFKGLSFTTIVGIVQLDHLRTITHQTDGRFVLMFNLHLSAMAIIIMYLIITYL